MMEYVIKSLAVIQNGTISTYKHAFVSSSFSKIKYEMQRWLQKEGHVNGIFECDKE